MSWFNFRAIHLIIPFSGALYLCKKLVYFGLSQAWLSSHFSCSPHQQFKRIRKKTSKCLTCQWLYFSSIVVAGGVNGSAMSSVEILEDGSDVWTTGPNLPFGIYRLLAFLKPHQSILTNLQLITFTSYSYNQWKGTLRTKWFVEW